MGSRPRRSPPCWRAFLSRGGWAGRPRPRQDRFRRHGSGEAGDRRAAQGLGRRRASLARRVLAAQGNAARPQSSAFARRLDPEALAALERDPPLRHRLGPARRSRHAAELEESAAQSRPLLRARLRQDTPGRRAPTWRRVGLKRPGGQALAPARTRSAWRSAGASRGWSGPPGRPAPGARCRSRAGASSHFHDRRAVEAERVTMCTATPVVSAARTLRRARGRDRAAGCAGGRRGSRRCRSPRCRGAAAPPSITSMALEVAGRLIAVAGDHQRPLHAGLAVHAGEKRVELVGGREVAHGKVWHRLEAGLAQLDRGFDRFPHRVRRHRAHIDARALGRGIDQIGDVVRARPRRLEREAAHEIRDRRDRIGALRPVVVVGEVVVMASHWPRVPGECSERFSASGTRHRSRVYPRSALNARKSVNPTCVDPGKNREAHHWNASQPSRCPVGVDGPRRHQCAGMRSCRSHTREPSVDKLIRIGVDTSKSVFVLHGVDAAEQPVLRRNLRRRQVTEFLASWSRRGSGWRPAARRIMGTRVARVGA